MVLMDKLDLDKRWWAEGAFKNQEDEARVLIAVSRKNSNREGGTSSIFRMP